MIPDTPHSLTIEITWLDSSCTTWQPFSLVSSLRSWSLKESFSERCGRRSLERSNQAEILNARVLSHQVRETSVLNFLWSKSGSRMRNHDTAFKQLKLYLRSPSECCTTQCICPVNHCCLRLPHPIEFEELNVRDCYDLRVSVRISTWLKIYILNTFPRIPVMALLDHGASGLTSPQETLPRKTWEWILAIQTLKI